MILLQKILLQSGTVYSHWPKFIPYCLSHVSLKYDVCLLVRLLVIVINIAEVSDRIGITLVSESCESQVQILAEIIFFAIKSFADFRFSLTFDY